MSVGKSVLTKNDIITLLRTQYNIEGNIEIKPTYNKGKKEEACKYCEYKSICCFNPNVSNYSFIDNKSKKELLDNLQ